MADAETIRSYDQLAREQAAFQRHLQPTAIYRLVETFFYPGRPTIDIGSGSGRDVAWLNQHGYQAIGLEPSARMIAEARAAYAGIEVRQGALPDLAGIADASFDNVLCVAVLMHLPAAELIGAAINLARILRPGGRLIVSYRTPPPEGERAHDGRLYTVIPPARLMLLLESSGLQILFSEDLPDPHRPSIRWFNLVAEKSDRGVSRGLERFESVLAHDRKTATYKLALLRALCIIARNAFNLVEWSSDVVYVPLRAIATQWLIFYWPLLTSSEFITQIRGEHPLSTKPIAFRPAITSLAKQLGGAAGLYNVLRILEEDPRRYDDILKLIANTIRKGPVTYSGSIHSPIFSYRPGKSDTFGWVAVPINIWLDICRFNHWIEDSIVLRWAYLTDELNRTADPGRYLSLLVAKPLHERDTQEVRQALNRSPEPFCVWTGQRLGHSYEVDHVNSVWGNNDLWNLLPAHPRINQTKRDALPARSILLARREAIIDYWQRYAQIDVFQPRFAVQIHRALGCDLRHADWPKLAFAGLEEVVERTAIVRGLPRWSP